MKSRFNVKTLFCIMFLLSPAIFIQTSSTQEFKVDLQGIKEEDISVNLVFIDLKILYLIL